MKSLHLISACLLLTCAAVAQTHVPTVPAPSVAMALDPSVPATGQATVTADFNGDGKMDLATVDNNKGGLAIRLGKGNGQFLPEVIYRAGYHFNALVAGDFNGDGKLDIAVSLPYLCGGCGGYPSYLLQVFLGAGDGTFNDLVVPKTHFYGLPLAAGDFNGDGKLDLIVTSTDYYGDDWYPQIALGNGDGTFQEGQSLGDAYGVTYPAVADFNGDGKLDIAMPIMDYYEGVETYIFFGNGDGTFPTPGQYITSGVTDATADVNGDGKTDIITDGVSVLLNNGDGTFTNDTNVSGLGIGSGGVVVGDFNGDGKIDFATLGNAPFSSSIYLGNNDGTFQMDVVEGAQVLQAADFNGDGKLDLLTTMGIYEQTPAGVSPTYLNFGDVNVGSKSTSQTATLTNVGTKTFPIQSVQITGTGANQFTMISHCGGSLAPGKSCQVQLVFAPTTGGGSQPSLTVTVPNAPPSQVVLFGAAL